MEAYTWFWFSCIKVFNNICYWFLKNWSLDKIYQVVIGSKPFLVINQQFEVFFLRILNKPVSIYRCRNVCLQVRSPFDISSSTKNSWYENTKTKGRFLNRKKSGSVGSQKNFFIRKKPCSLEDLSLVWHYTVPLCKNSESFSWCFFIFIFLRCSFKRGLRRIWKDILSLQYKLTPQVVDLFALNQWIIIGLNWHVV